MSDYRFKLAEQAQKHIQEMEDIFHNEIKTSISTSFSELEPTHTPRLKRPETPVNISVENIDTAQAIHNYNEMYKKSKICALNFASHVRPGGGFMKGSTAQEEMICHASTLYNVLSSDKFKDEYDNHRKSKNFLYDDWLIYSPNIIFPFRDEEEQDAEADIVTCAAPNIHAFTSLGYHDISEIDYPSLLNKRIYHILKVMSDQKVDIVILGAFGCGVFKNNPEVMAHCFHTILKSYDFGFKKVIFAIPTFGSDTNYNVFKKEFETKE